MFAAGGRGRRRFLSFAQPIFPVSDEPGTLRQDPRRTLAVTGITSHRTRRCVIDLANPLCICMYTYIHTYMHACIHTHT